MPPSMQMFSPVIKPTLSLQSMTQNYSYISYRGIFKSKNMHSRQEKAAKPARNWIPPACRAGKRLISCAEGAPEAFEAGKGGKSCAELDTNRLLSRKAPQILRRRCPGGIPGRKKYHFRRGMGYQPPPEQESTPNPAQKIANSLHKSSQHQYFSVFGNFAFLKKNS